MLSYHEKPYYTSSESMKLVLQPSSSVPKLVPSKSFVSSTNNYGAPSYQSLLKPSMIRSNSANGYSTSYGTNMGTTNFAAGSAFQYAKRQKYNENTRVVSPNPPSRLHYRTVLKPKDGQFKESPVIRSAPFGPRLSSAPAKFEYYDATVLPKYSTLDDPHLRDYYSRKFNTQNSLAQK